MDNTNNFINNSNITALPRIQVLICDNKIVTDWSMAAPIRPHWRFYWNPEPGAEVSDAHNKFFLDKDFILIIPPGVRVKQKLTKPVNSFYIHADIDLSLDDTCLRLMSLPLDPVLKSTVNRLINAVEQPLIAGEFIYAVISRLPNNIWRQPVADSRIESTCRLLSEQPEKNWSNPELAQKANFSENAFIRRFREVTGMPPQRFLMKQRLDRAATLLLENHLSIDEIAFACGFCDRHYLTKMFKKHFGQPPGRYRAGINTP